MDNQQEVVITVHECGYCGNDIADSDLTARQIGAVDKQGHVMGFMAHYDCFFASLGRALQATLSRAS